MKETECLITIRFLSQPSRLKIVRSVVRETALLAGCSEDTVKNIVLAVNEACMNVMQHGYEGMSDGDIILEIQRTGSLLEFSLIDFGRPFSECEIKPRNLNDLRAGGLGIYFIRVIMDRVDYTPLSQFYGTCLRMVKKIE